jgi:diguanylate cyclase (GGDEF)-like protein
MNLYRTEVLKGNLLVVDDTPNNLRFLATTLGEQGYKVRSVTNGKMALTVAQAALPDLILLDIRMPDMDGYQVCQRLKANKKTREIPVIFLSALDEAIDKVQAFSVGGVDYISKPFQLEEVLARIENQLKLRAAQAKIQQLNSELEVRVIQRTAQLEREIAEKQKVQEQLLHIACHDTLTGLPNRSWFLKKLGITLEKAKQNPNYLFAVLLVDCDRFKTINDSLGHACGDRLLISFARRLESCLNSASILSRLGGDEFIILLDKIKSIEEATDIVRQIYQEMIIPVQLEDYQVFINVSTGIVLGNKDYQQPEHILRDADTAMHEAKALGKSRYQIFDPQMHHRAISLLQLETDLRLALQCQEFLVYYQPIVSLSTGRITEFEALVRWMHPKRGLLPPAEFISVAEETEFIMSIDLIVLRQACHQLRLWQDLNLERFPPKISVNLSAKQFTQINLIDKIDEILQESNLESRYLKIEITESAIIENDRLATEIIEQLKHRQIEISLDDFGTGYSSLSYLHRFPIDKLKIDRSFISRIDEKGENLEMVRAILTFARNLGIAAIAEGVETEAQFEQLKAMGCHFAQGYYFSPPLDRQGAEKLLEKNPKY